MWQQQRLIRCGNGSTLSGVAMAAPYQVWQWQHLIRYGNGSTLSGVAMAAPYQVWQWLHSCSHSHSFINGIKALDVSKFEIHCVMCSVVLTSFPVPRRAFRRLQYGKAGRAWYISSCEHDVIDKWQTFQNEDAMFFVLFNHLHIQRSVSMTVTPR